MKTGHVAGPLPVGERDFTAQVIALAQIYGWRCAHFRPCRTEKGWRTAVQGDSGFPDLVLAKAGRVLFIELKTERGRIRVEQNLWLHAIGNRANHQTFLWRPRDWGLIQQVLGAAP